MDKSIDFLTMDIKKFSDAHTLVTDDEELIRKEDERREKELAEHEKDYEEFMKRKQKK